MSDMLIGKRVRRPASLPFYPYQPRSSQHSKVLRDQWLAHAEPFDELVDETGLLGKLHHNGQSRWCR